MEDKGFKRYSSALSLSASQTVSAIHQKKAASVKERVSEVSSVWLQVVGHEGQQLHSRHFIEDLKICSCLLDCVVFSDPACPPWDLCQSDSTNKLAIIFYIWSRSPTEWSCTSTECELTLIYSFNNSLSCSFFPQSTCITAVYQC